jgi:hypothetical protein
MQFFHESGDHALLSPGGKEEVEPELFTRGADATLRLVDVGAAGAVTSEVGTKAAPPFRLDARRKAVLLVDNLIVPIYYYCRCGIDEGDGFSC